MSDQETMELFSELMDIMSRLRSDKGCPWDRKQTHESLIPYLIEEAHEAASAIAQKDARHMTEELGDVLLQIVFHAQIGSENNAFNMKEIIGNLIGKLVRRHPHIFGSTRAKTAEEVIEVWKKVKRTENNSGSLKSVLDDIPASLPQLSYAQKSQERAAEVGFDWDHIDQVFEKVKEEWDELLSACRATEGKERIEEEFGDMLFALVNLGRFLNLNSEEALRKSSLKFHRRFTELERRIGDHETMKSMTLESLDRMWDEIKLQESPPDR